MLIGEEYVKSRGLAENHPATLTLVLMDTSFCADKEQVENGIVHKPDDWVEVEVSHSEPSFRRAVTKGVSFTAVMSPWFWVHYMVTLQVFNEISNELFLDFMHNGVTLDQMQKYHEYMSTLNQSMLSTKQ